MDKQKQIEEMAKETCGQQIYPCGEDRPFCFITHEVCNCCEDNQCDHYEICERIYNAGYRKIPEGSVVLTEEELKEKIDCCDVSMIHHDDDGKRYIEYEKYEDFTDRLGKRIQQLKGLLKQERKETAEKFAEMVEAKARPTYVNIDDNPRKDSFILLSDIYKICKELTEGM